MSKKQIIIFVGTSGSGKSTIAQMLANDFNLKIIDIVDWVMPIVKSKNGTMLSDAELKSAYQNFIKDLPQKDFDIVEIASDWPEIFIPKITDAVKKAYSAHKISVVFCSCELETAIERNNKRKRVVPEELLRKQDVYKTDAIKKICKNLGIEFIEIDTCGRLEYSYDKLKLILVLQ